MANVRKKSSKSHKTAVARTLAKRVTKAQPTRTAAKPTVIESKQQTPRVPLNTWGIARQALALLWQHKAFFAGYLGILAVLNILFVHNFGADVNSIKSQVKDLLGANAAAGGVATYALFLTGSTGAPAGAAGAYQYVLLIIGSLGIIWALRQYMSDEKPKTLRIRDAFYQSMYPTVQFVLVLIVLSLELLPLVITGGIYGLVLQSNVAVGSFEHILWLAVFITGIAASVWLLAGSLLAMYVVTLPGMTPIRALKSARKLAKGKRLWLIRKLLSLIAILLVLSAVLLIPILLTVAPLAGLVLFLLGVITLPFVHSYLYICYRELLP